MNASLFFLSLLIAVVGPVVAISYLKPILRQVLRMLCNAEDGAEFWVRCAYLLAVTGTLLLMLAFGRFDEGGNVIDTVRRSLGLVLAGVFVTVAIIARNVWTQVRQWLGAQSRAQADRQAAAAAAPRMPSAAVAAAAEHRVL